MKNQIVFVDINKLRCHEMVCAERLGQVKNDLLKRNYIKKPIVVDRKNNIILDGHHRVDALRQLGAKKVPAHLVDYLSNDVRVTLRRRNIFFQDTKQAVINCCAQGKLFPPKTTKHVINNIPKNINVPISHLL